MRLVIIRQLECQAAAGISFAIGNDSDRASNSNWACNGEFEVAGSAKKTLT